MNNNFLEDVKSKGEVGVKWLKEIPQIIKYLERKWEIKVGEPFDLSFNYVVSATRANSTKAVLKIMFPDAKAFQSEVDALKVFDGEGSVKLFEVSLEHFAMLLERAMPGIPLKPLEDDKQATKTLASVIKKLQKPVPKQHHFTDVKDFAKEIAEYKVNYRGAKNPLPKYLVDKAEEIIKYLIATSTKVVVNHGDLHHGNILSAQREPWLAIDPKGIVAERAYETGCMLRNPYPKLIKQPNLENILTSRIQILAEELELDPIRIKQWGFVQTVLGAIWRVEDYGTHYEHSVEIAKVLDKIKI